jgi:site-specific DNA-methyltransferase (adenine-specific)
MDCIEGMQLLKDNSVDLIIADPPYNIGKDVWDKWKKESDYLDFMKEWILESQRVLKDNGSFYWFHNQMPTISRLMLFLEDKSDYIFKQLITWSKIDKSFNNSGFVNQRLAIDMMRNYYNGFTEYLLFYTFQDETGLKQILPLCFKPYLNYMTIQKNKINWTIKQFNDFLGYKSIASHWFWQDKNYTLQPQPRFINENDYLKLQSTGYFQREYEDLRREYEDLRYTFNVTNAKEDIRSNCNVWIYPPEEKKGHITPKPIKLIENILLHSSNTNDIVLDPFMGSGTTAIACKNLNRNYIGFEINPDYIKLANSQLTEKPLTAF